MGAAEIEAFLTHLAKDENVSSSTQNQALNALLFLYHDVLEVEVSHLSGLQRVQRRDRLPVALSTDEVVATLAQMGSTPLTRTLQLSPMMGQEECHAAEKAL